MGRFSILADRDLFAGVLIDRVMSSDPTILCTSDSACQYHWTTTHRQDKIFPPMSVGEILLCTLSVGLFAPVAPSQWSS